MFFKRGAPKQEKPPDLVFPRSLPRSTRLLAAIGAFTLASTGQLDVRFLIFFLILFLAGLRVESHFRLEKILSAMQPAMATLTFILGLLDFFFLSNSFLLSVAHFLLLIQGLRLLSLRTPRESLGSILLSSLMMLSAATLSVEWIYFALLLFFLPVVLWTLILHNVIVENQAALRDNPADEIFSVLRDKSLLWRKMTFTIRSLSLLAFAVSMVCCAIVFIFFPRFSFQGFRGRFLQPVHQSGFTNEVDLAKSGRIYDNDSIVMRVELEADKRPLWSGYIRGSVLSEFNGRVWRAAKMEGLQIFNDGHGEIRVPTQTGYYGESVHQSVYLESMESPVLFALSKPARFYTDRPFFILRKDGSIQRPYGDSWRIHYDVISYVYPPFEKDLKSRHRSRSRDHFRGPGHETFLTLPGSFPQIESLARSLTQKEADPLAKAEAISRYLRTNYRYTRNLSLGNAKDPVSAFLFDTKEGHCEYFASAMAVMLRTVDIPSRLVTGFYSREWNERGNYYIVRMRHAHSWVEAFIEPYGWIEFDPSPLVWSDPAVQSAWLKQLGEMKDFLNLRWNRYILSYDIERQVELVRSINTRSKRITAGLDRWAESFDGLIRIKSWRSAPEASSQPGKTYSPPVLSGKIFLAILLTVVGLLALWIRSSRMRHPVWFYPALIRSLEKRGGKKPSGMTIKEFVLSLHDKLANLFDDAEYLERMYYRQRFGPSSFLAPQDNLRIKNALRRLNG